MNIIIDKETNELRKVKTIDIAPDILDETLTVAITLHILYKHEQEQTSKYLAVVVKEENEQEEFLKTLKDEMGTYGSAMKKLNLSYTDLLSLTDIYDRKYPIIDK